MPIRNRIFLTLLVGVVTFSASVYISHLTGLGPGDLRYSLWPARDWLAGINPYTTFEINNEYDIVPYPFTAILVNIPLVWLPDRIAAGIFLGFGGMLLTWLIL
ncbi:MAG TPA: hypothetical protein VLD65_04985, partial [Anaerolineales bacterium]|nr:hypothetical protein [Anaerolineales bacterium]